MLKVFLRQKILDIVVTFSNLSSSLFFPWQICIMTHTPILVLGVRGGEIVSGEAQKPFNAENLTFLILCYALEISPFTYRLGARVRSKRKIFSARACAPFKEATAGAVVSTSRTCCS